MALADTLSRWRYQYVPDHVVGEILTKRWIDNAIPFLFLVLVVAVFGSAISDFFTLANLSDTARQLGEFSFVVLAMTVVLLAGGIDLSVGSNFALCNFAALALLNIAGWSVLATIPAVILVGSAVGALNGFLVGYLRMRAFLTTLVTLIIVRAIVDMLLLTYAVQISAANFDSPVWDFIGEGSILNVPFSFVIFALFAIFFHVFLTRSRPGWHILAIGGSRRSAHNAGIAVRRTVCMTYALSGALVAIAGVMYAARLSSAGADTGVGLEITVLTAAVLGGISLGGGRGSVAKAVMGGVIVLIVTNSLVRLGFKSGSSSMYLGLLLLVAVAIDVRWLKNRAKVLAKVYVSPAFNALPPAPSTLAGSNSPYAANDRLKDVEIIGLGQVEAPEDVILDRDDNLFCGTRHGDIIRFFPPDYKRFETYAHIGGQPLGMAFDRKGTLLVCVGGMGLYEVPQKGEARKVTDETNRTKFSIIDDSRLRLADDLDIAPDGRIFFSEATIRYEMHTWPVDALESRGNGRIVCYDPRNGSTRTVIRNLKFPNGICMEADGRSFLFAETWGCCIKRYWFDGPKDGTVETVIADLPGFPDNINRASDGNYWLAMVGIRSPSLDLALRMPGFRRRMARRVAPDEWLYPNINTGCVLKFDGEGRILDSLWDLGGKNHPMITSMREHRGYLYLGGISNNRIGRYRIAGADARWNGVDAYWGDV